MFRVLLIVSTLALATMFTSVDAYADEYLLARADSAAGKADAATKVAPKSKTDVFVGASVAPDHEFPSESAVRKVNGRDFKIVREKVSSVRVRRVCAVPTARANHELEKVI